MKIRCLVVDDERLALEVMEAYIEKVPFLHLEQLCPTPMHALDYLSRNTVDVIFLDVEMPGLNGLQMLKTLKNPPHIILTTAYPQFAVDAFELAVVDYLLKPIPFPRFLASVQKIQSLVTLATAPNPEPDSNVKSSDYLFIKSGSKTVRLDLAEILFIEGKKEYTLIHLENQQVPTNQSLNMLMEKLPAEHFIRVHRSFIVALGKIDNIERNRIFIRNANIPVGDYYKDLLYKRIG
jgi:DNA-binding LytR/AlgR family response regulator